VKQRAEEIVAGRGDPLDKSRAIYDWIIENTHRDFQVAWCGLGDVKTMIESGNLCGKCVDINSLVVALARAVGLPAREVFGIRAAESRLGPTLGRRGDITNAQHCKGEVYLPGAGWVPVDPADVVKVTDERQPAEVIGRARDYFFGNAEDNWVTFNHARDFVLNPPQRGGSLNYFMYPYAESEGKRVELKPGNPGYTILSRVLERG
jgi:transglutaminase-like putative cysteine protease